MIRKDQYRRIGLLFFLIALAIGYWLFRDRLSLSELAASHARLESFGTRHPLVLIGAAFGLYVLVTGSFIPGASALSLYYAWFFGFWIALPLVSFASTAGATIAFLFSRHFVGQSVQRRYAKRMGIFNKHWQREGAYYLFMMRLIPAFPFFLVNALMGLTPVRVRTFWWVSQIGMLPGTCVYLFAGSQLPSAEAIARQEFAQILTPPLIAALVLLGVFPLVVRFYFAKKNQE